MGKYRRGEAEKGSDRGKEQYCCLERSEEEEQRQNQYKKPI